jgi:hypothetical protein
VLVAWRARRAPRNGPIGDPRPLCLRLRQDILHQRLQLCNAVGRSGPVWHRCCQLQGGLRQQLVEHLADCHLPGRSGRGLASRWPRSRFQHRGFCATVSGRRPPGLRGTWWGGSQRSAPRRRFPCPNERRPLLSAAGWLVPCSPLRRLRAGELGSPLDDVDTVPLLGHQVGARLGRVIVEVDERLLSQVAAPLGGPVHHRAVSAQVTLHLFPPGYPPCQLLCLEPQRLKFLWRRALESLIPVGLPRRSLLVGPQNHLHLAHLFGLEVG